jgi:hypothetical protein
MNVGACETDRLYRHSYSVAECSAGVCGRRKCNLTALKEVAAVSWFSPLLLHLIAQVAGFQRSSASAMEVWMWLGVMLATT